MSPRHLTASALTIGSHLDLDQAGLKRVLQDRKYIFCSNNRHYVLVIADENQGALRCWFRQIVEMTIIFKNGKGWLRSKCGTENEDVSWGMLG